MEATTCPATLVKKFLWRMVDRDITRPNNRRLGARVLQLLACAAQRALRTLCIVDLQCT